MLAHKLLKIISLPSIYHSSDAPCRPTHFCLHRWTTFRLSNHIHGIYTTPQAHCAKQLSFAANPHCMRTSLLLACLLLAATAFGQNDKAAIKEKYGTIRNLTRDVEQLAHDDMEGRETGTPGEAKAAAYIAKRFGMAGLKPKGTEEWYQEFEGKPEADPHGHGSTEATHSEAKDNNPIIGKNVIGYLDNGAATTVVIGAHYDHLGYGEEGSLHAGKKAIHNGADDNASGVAALIELATRLRFNDKAKNNNYLFIAFSGEEKGLWGSNWFCKHPTIDLKTVNYMMNMDMVGRLNAEGSLAVNGTGTSPLWAGLLSALPKDGLKLVTSPGGVGPSDHTSFYLQDIPVLHFFSGQHEDYHKPSDDADKINYDGMFKIVKFMQAIIESLDDDEKLAFTKTKDENSTKAPKFSVTLGVMPDYLFSGNGMRIDGIIDDRPAQKAGLQKGDVVIALGNHAVNDMRSYMTALSKFEKGDKTVVKVQRGDKEVQADIAF